MKNLILIFGDQLTFAISALKQAQKDKDIVLMAELRQEASYCRHHKKKIALIFSAMRHFAQRLKHEGWQTDYIKLTDTDNTHSFTSEIERALSRHQIDKIIVTCPSEYRMLEMVKSWPGLFGKQVQILEDNRFYASPDEFSRWAEGRKQLRMEYFYREIRRKTGILMENDHPAGGQWNYDSDNRSPPKKGLDIPAPTRFEPDAMTIEVLELVETEFGDHYGDLQPFHFAVTAEQAEQVLAVFITERLPHFGTYQDAMLTGQPFMYHAHIGFYLNCGLLLPEQAVNAALQAYKQGWAALHCVEGFIRQIIGWREFVRGLYWLKMPDYKQMNYFNARRCLPDFFWDAQTDMMCLHHCLRETKENAYAHHIQRLMVIGNFALLAGLDTDAVNDWYLCVYADAYEWVELPNVTGMILYADGGILASKPYAAGGAYIQKMSDYCKNCSYSPSVKSGPEACPFGYLYWAFLGQHEDKLRNNPRLGMIYRSWDKFTPERKKEIFSSAQTLLDKYAPSQA